MRQEAVIDGPVISPQREQWARHIAHILYRADLDQLEVLQQVACHGVAHYTERLLAGLNQPARDEQGNK
jgi:hypothetical protein